MATKTKAAQKEKTSEAPDKETPEATTGRHRCTAARPVHERGYVEDDQARQEAWLRHL